MKKILLFIKDIGIILGFFIIYSLLTVINLNLFKEGSFRYNIFDLFSVLLLCLILTLIYKNTIQKDFQDFKKNIKPYFKKYIKYYFISYLIMIVINLLLMYIVKDQATNQNLNEQSIVINPFFSFINMCIIAPYYEEILLRLNLRNLSNNRYVYVLISGLIFGSLHLLAADSLIQLLYILPYSIMGMMLALVYYDSNNIFASIMIHAFNNLLSVILVLGGF